MITKNFNCINGHVNSSLEVEPGPYSSLTDIQQTGILYYIKD